MKFKKIGTRMLTILLSVSIISMIALTMVSYLNSREIIQSQIQKNMDSELKVQVNNIQLQMQKVSTMASLIAQNVESTYMTTSLLQYEDMLGSSIYNSDLVLGSGVWFEPYAYDKTQEYVGPYVYKEDKKAVVTYDYSNKEYNYFGYDWYKNAMGGAKEPVFSELYYDETLDATMTSCTVAMYDANEKFIGVVTVDTEITAIQDMINQVRVGKSGRALLMSKDGAYITNEDADKVLKEKISENENKSLSSLGKEILKKESGRGYFSKNNEKYDAFFTTVDGLGWKIMIQIPKAEVDKPLNSLLVKLIIIGLVTILLSIIAIVSQIRYLTKNIKKVKDFALCLAEGDFSISQLDIKSKDELGQMGSALNKMLVENKSVIGTIATDSEKVYRVSEELDVTTVNLVSNFEKIEEKIVEINEDMMSSSAATEELNASVEEVNASVNFLANETTKSYEMAKDIKARATEVKSKSEASYLEAIQLADNNEQKLNQSIEDAKIVESIGVMAEMISQIAEQVNLLSLNASIEAARAGEQGRGFAVVANEIGSLASQTTSTVSDIKQTTTKVQTAFDNLMSNSMMLLSFIKETVTPDYKMFVEIAKRYGQDANDIEKTVTTIANMTNNIEKVINEVGDAIQNIAEVSQNTASSSGVIITNMDSVAELIGNISEMVGNEKQISSDLDSVVKNFKLS